jgi:hypothetical protein
MNFDQVIWRIYHHVFLKDGYTVSIADTILGLDKTLLHKLVFLKARYMTIC